MILGQLRNQKQIDSRQPKIANIGPVEPTPDQSEIALLTDIRVLLAQSRNIATLFLACSLWLLAMYSGPNAVLTVSLPTGTNPESHKLSGQVLGNEKIVNVGTGPVS